MADESDPLFFRDVVRSYTDDPRHLRREWLGELVRKKLQQSQPRYVVLAGDPGSGKSSLIAQYASDNPGTMIYLLRRDQRSALAGGSAKAFLVRVGLQFASLHPEAFETDAIRVEVTQSSATTSADSAVLGARIGRMMASPFYQTVVRVRQDVQSLGGRLTGLEIDELVSDPALLSVSDLEALALRTPAEILLRTHPDIHLVILVDALDELAKYRTSGGGRRYESAQDSDLGTWLHDLAPLPANVQFVLTSRPGEALEAFVEKQAPFVARITLDQTDQHIQDDIGDYTRMLAAEMSEADVFSDDAAEKRFIEQARGKAMGNLGYVGALGRAFDHALSRPDRKDALAALLNLAELPPSLQDLYAFFFHQIKAQLAGKVVEIEDKLSSLTGLASVWPAVHQKLISVLSVVHEPLTVDQVADLGQIVADRGYYVDAIDDLQQFLRRTGNGVSFYHPTVAEFLTDLNTRDEPTRTDLFVDPVLWNGRIAKLLAARFAGTPDALDDYGIRYRIAHEIVGGGAQSGSEALTSAWMLSKRERTGDDRSFHADLDQVARALRDSPTPDLVAVIRCYLLDAMLLARLRVLPSPVAAILAICGDGIKAQSLISLVADAGKRADAYVELAAGLTLSGAADSARDALRSAIEAARLDPHYGDRLFTLLKILSSPDVDPPLASSVLDVAHGVGIEAPGGFTGDIVTEFPSSIATLYERASVLLPIETAAQLRARLEGMLKHTGSDEDHSSVLLSAASISEVLGDASAAASFAERALAIAGRPSGVAAIRSLCKAASRLGKLTVQSWAAKALQQALAHLKEGLEHSEGYAAALIAKTGLTIPGFDVTDVDIEQAFQLLMATPDPVGFRLLAEIYADFGDISRATQAADLCHESVREHFRNQEDHTSAISTDVILAYRACKSRAGLLKLLDDADTFKSPGYEWERDHIVEIVSAAAVDLRFNDVLERAVEVADHTRNIWERASALSRVGRSYATAGDKPRARSILKIIEEGIADGLRRQFRRKHIRGAFLLANALSDRLGRDDLMNDDESFDPRYLAVARAVLLSAGGVSNGDESLAAIVDSMAQWQVEEYCDYTLFKLVAAAHDVEADAAVLRLDERAGVGWTKETIQNLRKLAMSKEKEELLATARAVVDSFHGNEPSNGDWTVATTPRPGAAYAVVDALMTAGLSKEAAGFVEDLRISSNRPRANALDKVGWEAVAYLAEYRLLGAAGSQPALIALLDHARVDSICAAETLAATAPAIAAMVSVSSINKLFDMVDEVAALA